MFISSKKKHDINKFWLILFDIFSLGLSIFFAVAIRFGMKAAQEYIGQRLLPLFISLFIFLVFFYVNGLYEPRLLNKYLRIISRISLSVLFAILLNSLIFYATFSMAIGRGVFILIALFVIILTTLPRMIYILIVSNKILDRQTIIIGSGESIIDAIDLINKYPSSLCHIIGVVAEREGVSIPPEVGYKILGSTDEINEIIKGRKVDRIIVTTLEPKRAKILKNLRICSYHGIEVIDLVSLYEELEGQVPLKYIDDEWLFSSISNYPGFHVKKLKRLMDIIGSLIGLVITFPVCLIAAIIIKLDSKGPVFYRQKRLGRYTRPFRIIKFRTMVHHAERGLGAVWAKEEDSRITRVGKFLRKTRIDEIPQLINVFLGQMSLVGPRPERAAFIKELSEKIPFYPERLYVQPGVTGWAQINYPYASSLQETKIKLQYDLYYIKHTSFFLDCQVLLKTIKITFLGFGR